MRRLTCMATLLICGTSSAQSRNATPQFDVVSIRPVARGATDNEWPPPILREAIRDSRRPGEIPMLAPDRVRLRDWTVLDLVAVAYGVRPAQVLGPDWMKDQAYDVQATVAVGTSPQALNAMLRSMLEERFGLQAHRTLRTGSGFALTVGKGGPRLQSAMLPAADAKEIGKDEQEEKIKKALQANVASMRKRMQDIQANGGSTGSFRSETMPAITTEELAARLVRYAGAPVIDATGLPGRYRVTIEVDGNANEPGGSVSDAVAKLGLKLEPRRVTIEAVIVDQVSKAPTPN